MSTIGLAPIRMREATLAIGADDYTISVDQVIFTPQPEIGWSRTECDVAGRPYIAGVKWYVSVGFAQDFTSPLSLSTYLVENAGQQRTITLEVPGRVVSATVLILPAQLGGVANQIPASVVTLPVYGEPSLGD